jgi:phosphatidylserine decarboxylase
MRRPRIIIKPLIRLFMNVYGIRMDEYRGEVDDYRSLSDFFIRPLDPAKRTLSGDASAIVSPADGRLTEIQTIYEDKATQVKGKTYSVSEMVGESLDFSKGWHIAVVYLAPSNYHRYHYPVSGRVTRYLHTGPRLYPVNDIGLNYVDRLFIRNERIVTEMSVNGQTCYFVAVGATFVGSIKMEYIKPDGYSRKHRNTWITVADEVKQIDEMGRFEMGSTIVMVVPADMAEPLDGLAGQPVRVGLPIFRI